MSAKDHQLFTPATIELVSVERLSGIAYAAGKQGIWDATVPGLNLMASTQDLSLYYKGEGLRSEYFWMTFHAEDTHASLGYWQLQFWSWRYSRYDTVAANDVKNSDLKKEWAHIHRAGGLVTLTNAAGTQFVEPTIVRLRFHSGSFASMIVRDVVFGGSDTNEIPFVVRRDGLVAVNYSKEG